MPALDLTSLFWLFLIGLGLVFWWQALKVRERAFVTVKQYCQRLGVQFLDHSVALKSIRLERNWRGVPQLVRRYCFEFSSTGGERYGGEAILRGNKVEKVTLDIHRIPEDQGTKLP